MAGQVWKNVTVKKIRKTGYLLITCPENNVALKMCEEKDFYGKEISVASHKTLNFSKAIFSCDEITQLQDETILEELREQNVTYIR